MGVELNFILWFGSGLIVSTLAKRNNSSFKSASSGGVQHVNKLNESCDGGNWKWGDNIVKAERGDIFVKRKCDFLCTLEYQYQVIHGIISSFVPMSVQLTKQRFKFNRCLSS